MIDQARPVAIPEDPRLRARWTYHAQGHHTPPHSATHYYTCRWCDPTLTEMMGDGECEVMRLPALPPDAYDNPDFNFWKWANR